MNKILLAVIVSLGLTGCSVVSPGERGVMLNINDLTK